MSQELDCEDEIFKSFMEEYRSLVRLKEFGSTAWLDDLFRKNPLLAEMQASEACDWLKETGFPQYAHMYQVNQMPIDLEAVKRDHSFLDEISLQSLFKRLEILNKCSFVDITRPAKVTLRSEALKNVTKEIPNDTPDNDMDSEQVIALSHRWTYEPGKRRWSRSCEAGTTRHSDLNFIGTLAGPEKKAESDKVDGFDSDISEVNSEGDSSRQSPSVIEPSAESSVSKLEHGEKGVDLVAKESQENVLSPLDVTHESEHDIEFLETLAYIENISDSNRNPAENVFLRRELFKENTTEVSSELNTGYDCAYGKIFSVTDESSDPDYRDVFETLADLSKSLITETVDEKDHHQSSDKATWMGSESTQIPDNDKRSDRPNKASDNTDLKLDHSIIHFRRKQMNQQKMPDPTELYTSRLSASSSSVSSPSSLSMASYTLSSNISSDAVKSGVATSKTSHVAHQNQNIKAAQQSTDDVDGQVKTCNESSLVTDSDNQATPTIAEATGYLFNQRSNINELSHPWMGAGISASRDSVCPQTNIFGQCFPKSTHHHQTPPSPLLTRTADRLRNLLRRSLKRKSNVKDAKKDFLGGLVKSDIGSPCDGEISPLMETKLATLKCFPIAACTQYGGRELVSEETTDRSNVKRKSEMNCRTTRDGETGDSNDNSKFTTDVEMSFPSPNESESVDENRTLSSSGSRSRRRSVNLESECRISDTGDAVRHKARTNSLYDNVCEEHEFDKILDDLYNNIYLLDQSLGVETDDDSKSLTSSTTPSSSNESQSHFNFTTQLSTDTQSSLKYSQTSEPRECGTLKSVKDKPTTTASNVFDDEQNLQINSINHLESDFPAPKTRSRSEKETKPSFFKSGRNVLGSGRRIPCTHSPDDDDDDDDRSICDEGVDDDDDDDGVETGDDNMKWSYADCGERERRDSGVGSSLTRRPSNRRTVRWQSFLKTQPRSQIFLQDLTKLSAQQIAVLEKYCLLRISSILEKYGSISRKSWKNLMNRKQKAICLSDYPQNAVFGVPLEVLRIRHSQALPKCVLLAMKKLRRSIADCDGIFRKAGLKSRVQALKSAVVLDPESVDYEMLSVHDLADMLKAFLKELPECLFTEKFSKILIGLFKNVPKELHSEAVQSCLVLMPSDHRDSLHTFMLFCYYLSTHSHVTQMTASNLAVCLSPSFFHLKPVQTNKKSAYKKYMDVQKVVQQCLTYIIENAPQLFANFQSLLEKCQINTSNNLSEAGFLSLQEFASSSINFNPCSSYLRPLFQFVEKETKPNSKGWSVPNTISSACLIPSFPSPSSGPVPELSVEVSYKKSDDSVNPLRLWRCSMVIEAPPVVVLAQILRNRHLWDLDFLKWRCLEKINNDTEVFQYVLNNMAPHPPRTYTELRSWYIDTSHNTCILVCQSVEHSKTNISNSSVCAEVQACHYQIKSCGSGRCQVIMLSKIDFKGYSKEWYNVMYEYICASHLLRLALGLKNNFLSNSNTPETKV